METIILDNFPYKPNLEQFTGPFKIKAGTQRAYELDELLAQAKLLARPKAIYKIAQVEIVNDEIVCLDGKPFESRVLCINIGEAHRAFPFVITCGIELHEWKKSFDNFFARYMADYITSIALEMSMDTFFNRLKNKYGLGKTATMNPGSLEDWPLQAQIPLFNVLGDPCKAIGVQLTDSLLMVPRHSVSGILFETETDFVNCRLCPRKTCSNRRAPFDEELRSKYTSS